VGSYSINNSTFDVIVMVIFGLLGYLFKKFEFEAAPLVLAFVLGPMFETNLRQSLLLSKGSFMIFINRPISATFISIALILLITAMLPNFKKAKQQYDASI
jgi:putative tricarboxylic transport membrane protein